MPGNRYINVIGGTTRHYIGKTYSSGSAGKQGDMMYDLDGQNIKVFDGSTWQSLSGGLVTVELTDEASSILDWAKKKRDEELELEKLAIENPAIKDLMDQIKTKQNQIKMVQTLIQKEVTV
jgi:hypothetical protein